MPVSAPEVFWNGVIHAGLGWSRFTGRAGDNRPHAHHAFQVLIANSPCPVWVDTDGWVHAAGMIISPNVAHQLAPTNEAVTLYFVDPETRFSNELRERFQTRMTLLSSQEIAEIQRGLLTLPPSLLSGEWVVSVLTGTVRREPPRSSDVLVATVIEALPSPVPKEVTAATMGASAGLSTSRFQHRFRAYTGMAVRPYLRWRRLLEAIAGILGGESISRVAQDAGFADAAHLTRTLKRHFGVTPKTLARLSGS